MAKSDVLVRMKADTQNYDANMLRNSIIKKFSNESVGKLLDDIYKNLN